MLFIEKMSLLLCSFPTLTYFRHMFLLLEACGMHRFFYQIMVNGYATLFSCTVVVEASESMTAST